MYTSWSHKLYWCQKRKGVYHCLLQLKHVNFWMPRSFVWTQPDDTNALKAYIDALHEKNKAVSSVCEDKGMAIDMAYEEAPANVEMVRIDPVKLMAFLRGEYVLEIPCTGRLLAVDSPKKKTTYMPQEVQAALLAADGPLAEMYTTKLRALVNSGRPVLAMTEKEIENPTFKALGIEAWKPNNNIQTDEPEIQAQPEDSEAPEEKKEIEISRVEHETYTEVNSTYNTYFIRRYYRGKDPFYGASSYDTKSWSVFFMDQPIYDTIFQHEMSA